MKKYNYFLFDLDGTLINTIDLIVDCFKYSIEKLCGIKLSFKDIVNHVGLPLKEQFKVYLKEKSNDIDLDQLAEQHMEYQLAHWKGYIYIYEGVTDLLEFLQKNNKKTAVVTSRRIETTELYMKELELIDYFNTIITPEVTKNHKPHEEPAIKAIEKMNGTKNETLFIGDSEFDMKCAANGGIDSYLVTWKKEETKDLFTVPTYNEPDFKKLYNLI